MPIELRLDGNGQSKSVVLNPSSNEFSQTVKADFAIDSIVFDPNLWVLATHEVHNTGNLDNGILLYPNPAKGVITVSAFGNEFTDYRIFDLLGKEILSGNTEPAQNLLTTIDVSALTNGLYLIELRGSDTKSVARFVKE